MNHEITYNDIESAYRKLKSYAYYDTNDLFLKSKIASFESEDTQEFSEDTFEYKSVNFKAKLMYLQRALNNEGVSFQGYWNNKLNEISYKVLPKLIQAEKSIDKIEIENVFTNSRIQSEYSAEKVVLYIDAPIEVYIVSILWIIKLGYRWDMKFDSHCYGNRLTYVKNSNGKLEVPHDENLFKPYFKQYQRWRDEGVLMARQLLDSKQDVLFLSFDIKDFYYNVRFPLAELNVPGEDDILVRVFKQVHITYANLIKKTDYPTHYNCEDNQVILPIGLPSSYILANRYLSKFDQLIRREISPAYYSRYVDDMFLVISDPEIKKEDLKELISKTLLKVTDRDNEESDEFKLKGYKNLVFQSSKTLVYHFNHNYSLSLIEKFQTELEKRSSEYRFMPEEDSEDGDFSSDAYHLIYDDSQGKIKTLKDYRENKYGLAAYLAKQIYYTLRNGSNSSKTDTHKILRFFSGKTNFDHFRQWEKLVTYFVVTDNHRAFVKFYNDTLKEIISVVGVDKAESFSLNIKLDLLEFFHLSIEMAFCLDPEFVNSVVLPMKKIQSTHSELRYFFEGKDPFELPFKWQRLRVSNMMRHHYVKNPLANYTVSSKGGLISLIKDLEPNDDGGYEFDDDLIMRSPRKVKFWEVAWRKCEERVRLFRSTQPESRLVKKDFLYEDNSSYLNDAFDDFWRINYWWYKGDGSFKNEIKAQYFRLNEVNIDGLHNSSVKIEELHVYNGGKPQSKLRVGVANINVDSKDYSSSMLGKHRAFNRYTEFAKLLNTAEQEKCDLVAFPELCLPYNSVWYIAEYSWRNQKAIVIGLEHWTENDIAYNFILTLLPCVVNGIRDAVPILRLKNHYAPSEELWINDFRRIVPKPFPYRYHLFRWRGAYFTVFYCFELSDITHRSLFRSKLDFMVASEWNPDTPYFSNIVGATSRDVHCYFVQSNTSQYGDSRVTKPAKSEKKDMLRISGGKNTVLVVEDLELDKLREFQYSGINLQKLDRTFKPVPPDFIYNDVIIRQKDQSFSNTKE